MYFDTLEIGPRGEGGGGGAGKLERTLREGCVGTSSGACTFGLGTYPERGRSPSPGSNLM